MNPSKKKKSRTLVIVFAVLIFATFVVAQDVPLIPRSEIFAPADKKSVQISVDGSKVSWIAELNGVSNLFVAPIENVKDAEPLFGPTDGSITSYVWLYSKGHVVYTSVTKDLRFGLYVFDVSTGRKREITPADKQFTTIQRISPDSPYDVLVTHGSTFATGDIYKVNAETGEKMLVLKGDAGFSKILFDNFLRPSIGQKATADGGFNLFRIGKENNWEKFLTVDRLLIRESNAHSVDRYGKTLYMVDNRTTDKAVLKAIDIKSGKEKILASDRQADLVQVPMINPVSGLAESATSYFGTMRRHYVDRSVRKDFDFLAAERNGDVGIAGRSVDDKKWLVVYQDGGPLKYYFYDREKRTTHYLLSDQGGLEKYKLAGRESIVIKTRDGLRFPAQLYLPPNTATVDKKRKPLPMLVYVHGGPFVAYPWNSWYTNRIIQLLANRGYAVLRVEFRGAGGFGKKMIDAGNLEWSGKMDDDVEDAVEWAISNGITTREQVGIYGWSYGGYATLSALTFRPGRYACGFALYPVSDLNELAGWSDLMRRKLGEPSTKAGKAHLHETSPLFHVKNITKPLLITHGGMDNRARPFHSDKFVEAMKKAGKPVTYVYYANEPHDYREPANWASLFAIAERFFSKHLGGRFEPAGLDLSGKGYEFRAGKDLIPGLGDSNMDSMQ